MGQSIGDKMHTGVAKVMRDFGLDPYDGSNENLYLILECAWINGYYEGSYKASDDIKKLVEKLG